MVNIQTDYPWKLGRWSGSTGRLHCKEKYPNLVCRALAAKFTAGGTIALFELTIEGDSVKIVQEKHYGLVPESSISDLALQDYNDRAS